MLSYEILDTIADVYNPLLFVGYIAYSAVYFKQKDRVAWLVGFLGVALCYVIMFIDDKLNIWQAADLDYSTHSSVALALVFFHLHKRNRTSFKALAIIGSLVAYYALVLFQRYHSIADIATTVLIVGPLLFAMYRVVWKRQVLPGLELGASE